jgi:hypothetical protein
MDIIMQIKQFSNIKEYVKCVLQIFVHILFKIDKYRIPRESPTRQN